MRRVFFASAAALSFTALMLAAPRAAGPQVQVMIVGTYHMSNPGRDMHDVTADDVLAPKRQAEIARIVNGIARFNPTEVDVEWDAETAAKRYQAWLAGTLPPSRNEVVQLGFRLAQQAHLAAVNGIDVEADFPYEAVDTFARAHGQAPLLAQADADVAAEVAQFDGVLAHGTIGETLAFINDPARIAHDNAFYRTTLKVGAGADQPGAELLTAWYRRNFIICAHLIQLAHQGDRVVAFYGSGHAFLLRQCIGETPGFSLVEPDAWIAK